MKNYNPGRRNFLKKTGLGTAALLAGSAGIKTARAKTSGWYDGLQINPQIDNMRVAYTHDPETGTGHPLLGSDYINWEYVQDNVINQPVVEQYLDKMAMALAGKSFAEEAWQTIFQKPASKASWSEVTAAIKPNADLYLNPSAALVNAVVEALHNLGIPYGNITLFDNGWGSDINRYADRVTGNVNYDNNSTPPTTDIRVEDANGRGSMRYNSLLNETDILISIAVCKSHDQSVFGYTSMTLKNHVATIFNEEDPRCPNRWDTQLEAMNKSSAIIGEPDHENGLPPRQQLAIVDGLFASRNQGYTGQVDCDPPGVMAMGTLAGVLDYLMVHKVRIPLMDGAEIHNLDAVRYFITEFGYTRSEAEELLTFDPSLDEHGRGWVDALAWEQAGTTPGLTVKAPQFQEVLFGVEKRRAGSSTIRFLLKGNQKIINAQIYTLAGKQIQTLHAGNTLSNKVKFTWDGNTDSGTPAAKGTYLIKINTANGCKAGHVSLVR